MALLVVDASVALAWGMPDETNLYADKVLETVRTDGLRMPAIWLHEIANGLAVALLRKRITADQQRIFLQLLSRLPLAIETRDVIKAIENDITLANRFGLTAYDAAYLELSLREKLPLATLDRALHKAAAEAGAVIFGS